MANINRHPTLTPAQIIATRKAAGLTQTAAAALIGKSLGAWQKWESPVGMVNHRKMDPALFKLFMIEIEKVKA